MKKADLLKLPALTVTEKMAQLVAEDKRVRRDTGYPYHRGFECYERYLYYRAVARNGFLKLAVFTRYQIAKGKREPQFEIYISREEKKWLNYEPDTGRWLTAKLDMLDYDYGPSSGYVWGNKPYADEQTKKTVNEYLGTGKKEVREAVLTWQQDIRKDQLHKKHRSELDAIDMVMDAVPDYPKDFDDWVLKYGFYNHRYIFYRAGKKTAEGLCTHCRKMVQLKVRPTHNVKGTCPECRSKVTFKAWAKQKYISDEKYIALLQRLTDDSGYILRKFRYKVNRDLGEGWDKYAGGAWEEIRVKLDDRFQPRQTFEFGEYKNTGIERWCYDTGHGYYGNYGGWYEQAVLYSSNIRQVLKDSHLRYMPVKELLEANRGRMFNAREVFRTLLQNPEYEFLIKAGLKRFAFDMLANQGESVRVDQTKKRPWEFLRISKEQFEECCRRDAAAKEIRVWQMANESQVKLEWQQVSWISDTLGRSTLIEHMRATTPHKMIRYLREQLLVEENKAVVKDYHDYLDDLKELGRHREDLMYPQDFQRTHQETHLEVLELKDAREAKKQREQEEIYRRNMAEKKSLLEYEDDTYRIIVPDTRKDFQEEGRNMHNCVGGYFEKVANGKCTVLFLREKTDPGKCFCTVEIQGTKLIQCRAAYNKNAPEPAMEFMAKYLKVLEKRMEKEKKEKAREQALASAT